MSAIKFTATCPDGTVVTRTSKTMAYLFAIVVDGASERYRENGWSEPASDKWGAWGWSQSLANAEKAANQARKHYTDVRVVPATMAN